MAEQDTTPSRLRQFASLNWYEETIRFVFNFVTKTSELLLAAGIVISTANFLTDGDIMSHNKALSDAWSWAQALAIDSSLGIVFVNGFQAIREREKIKAIIFFTLTVLLATVAGLITHFDAYSHASGLPVSDKSVSGIIPLWIMTALRAIAVIGFLLASRLKNFSFNQLRRELAEEPIPMQSPQPQQPLSAPVQERVQIDYQQLAHELAPLLQAVRTTIIEEVKASITAPASEAVPPQIGACVSATQERRQAPAPLSAPESEHQEAAPLEQEPAPVEIAPPKAPEYQRHHRAPSPPEAAPLVAESATTSAPHGRASASQKERLERAYQELLVERPGRRISGRALSERARVHRTTCTRWLKRYHPEQEEGMHPEHLGEEQRLEEYQQLEPEDVTPVERQDDESAPTTGTIMELAASAPPEGAMSEEAALAPEASAREPAPVSEDGPSVPAPESGATQEMRGTVPESK